MKTFLRAIVTLAATVAASALLWTPGAAAPAPLVNNLGLNTIPFQIVNTTGLTGNLFLYVYGLVGADAYFLSNVNGDVTIVPAMSTPTQQGLDLGTGRVITVMLPQLVAARIYFSIGSRVYVTSSGVGKSPAPPASWVPTDPNYKIYHDFAEYTWLPEAPPFATTLGMNATQLDGLGFAMLLQLSGKNDNQQSVTRKSGFGAGARAKIFNDLDAVGKPWGALIVGNKPNPPLRVNSPYHGIETGTFPANQMDTYIDQVWDHYRTNPLTGAVDIGLPTQRTYRGMVNSSNVLVFQQVAGPGPNDPDFSVAKPTTYAAYLNSTPPIPCGDSPAANCIRAREITRAIGPGIMRTTILANSDLYACKVALFYSNPPINMYAEVFHLYGVRHQAYSFGFDDTCDQSSFIQIHDPTMLKITLQPFN